MANHFVPNVPLVEHDSLKVFYEIDKEIDWNFTISENGISIPNKAINDPIEDVLDIEVSEQKDKRRAPRNSVLESQGGGTFLYYGMSEYFTLDISIWHKRGDQANLIMKFPYDVKCELSGMKWSPNIPDSDLRLEKIQRLKSMVLAIQPFVRINRLKREIAAIKLRQPLKLCRLTFHNDKLVFKISKKGFFNKMLLQKEEHECTYQQVHVVEEGDKYCPTVVTVSIDGYPEDKFVYKKGFGALFGGHQLMYLVAPLVDTLRSKCEIVSEQTTLKTPAIRLKELEDMYSTSLITEQEYNSKRSAILNDV
jgi:hypothetical protein